VAAASEQCRHDVYPLSREETLRTLTADLPRHPLRAVTQAVGMRNYTFPFRPLRFAAAALGQGDPLFDNRGLARFLRRALPVHNLEDTRLPLCVLTMR
jgi:hypothetical protein